MSTCVFRKRLTSVFAIVILIISCIVPVSADSYYDDQIDSIYNNLLTWCIKPDIVNDEEDEFVAALHHIQSVWRTSLDTRKLVTYDTLQQVYVAHRSFLIQQRLQNDPFLFCHVVSHESLPYLSG